MDERVLVAEDDRAIREPVTRTLELVGYRPISMADCPTALLRAAESDLPLLGLMMPGVDGFTVCRALRSQGSGLPILIVPARTETPRTGSVATADTAPFNWRADSPRRQTVGSL